MPRLVYPPDETMTRLVAFVLSLFAVGTGQVLLGRWVRGALWLALGVLAPLVVSLSLPAATLAGWFGVAFGALLLTFLVRPISAIDAALIAPNPERRPGGLAVGAVFIGSLGLLVSSALLTRIFVLEAFKTPSEGMRPSLNVGDHMFVDKRWSGFARGRVIVFQYPEQREQDFVKRVIAISGDRLEMRAGHPWINGWEVPHCAMGHETLEKEDLPGSWHADVFIEYLDGEAYLTLIDQDALTHDEGPWTIRPGEAFVLGDNRDNSHDSRRWFGGAGGGVPAEFVHGEAFVVWLSVHGGHVGWGHSLATPTLPRELSSLKPAFDRCLATRPTRESTIPPKAQ